MHLCACYSGEVITNSYDTYEMRGNGEPQRMLLKTQGQLRRAKTEEQEAEINDNVIWWHSWASCSPLVVSPSTNSELKRANFVWIGFNLSIRQCEAASALRVFLISPQEKCVRFCKCTSSRFVGVALRQAACSNKKLTKLGAEWLDCWEKYLQKHMCMTTKKQKKSDSLCCF